MCSGGIYHHEIDKLSLGEITGKFFRTTCDKKIGSNIFIVDKFCKKCTCKIGDFKIVKHVYM
jgi:hypothetical protein